MAKLSISAITSIARAAPGNSERACICLAITDRDGKGVSDLTETNFRLEQLLGAFEGPSPSSRRWSTRRGSVSTRSTSFQAARTRGTPVSSFGGSRSRPRTTMGRSSSSW